MTERWLRWYDGTVRDGKMHIVARSCDLPVCTVIGIWASLLEDAATSEPRGTASRNIGFHAMYLQINDAEIETVWNALERVGAVTLGDGVHITNWDKRQFETDARDPTSRNRKDKWKQAHKKSGTVKNATERIGTPETETETYTDKKDIAPSAHENDFDIFYKAYPKKRAPKEAKKAYLKAIRDGATHQQIIAGLERAIKSDGRFKDQQFTPYAASWLNAGCFDDEKPPPPPTREWIEENRTRAAKLGYKIDEVTGNFVKIGSSA